VSTRVGVQGDTDAVSLVDGSLYQLPGPFELNGLVSSHPVAARGYAPLNAYLLVEGDRALLIDTGFSSQEKSLLRQLDSVLEADAAIEIFPTSLGEYATICNARPVTERFNGVKYYGILKETNTWMDFRADYVPYGTEIGSGKMALPENSVVHNGDRIHWADGRNLDVLAPPIRLLPSFWAYDGATSTLFTGDSFSYLWHQTDAGPWTVTSVGPLPDPEDVYDFMVNSRFWWIPGADTETIKRDLAELFASFEVKNIAPRYGCAIRGEKAVSAHHELLQCVLDIATQREPTGGSAGSERMGRSS
jgi:hypothetical protein